MKNTLYLISRCIKPTFIPPSVSSTCLEEESITYFLDTLPPGIMDTRRSTEYNLLMTEVTEASSMNIMIIYLGFWFPHGLSDPKEFIFHHFHHVSDTDPHLIVTLIPMDIKLIINVQNIRTVWADYFFYVEE